MRLFHHASLLKRCDFQSPVSCEWPPGNPGICSIDISCMRWRGAYRNMGIPRLSQDLLPYADRVVLGASPQASFTPTLAAAANIPNLIVDGPSLVYFVYNKLLSHGWLRSLTATSLPPIYNEINQGIQYLLKDFKNHGITIQHVFFDGGLPKFKRDVRLERMDKLRQQLEIYRKLHSDFPPIVASTSEVNEFEEVLWDTTAMSTRKSTLPPPPFMVASVIESLCATNSESKNHVHVVPGEADAFCARAARESSEVVAILTNDSDLAIHDLGHNGRVAWLHSIEKKQQKSVLEEACFTALSLHPAHVASRLNVPSLFNFGYERFLESGASTAVIQERVRGRSKEWRLQKEFALFRDQFSPSEIDSMTLRLCLERMDPRTAEVVIDAADSPHVYLTPVVEDPERDSSWLYGADIRRLAYSLLLQAYTTTTVTEYAKKGQRIASTSVSSLPRAEILVQAAQCCTLLASYLPPLTFDQSLPKVEDATVLLSWYALAIHLVHQEKFKLDKSPPTLSHIIQLLGLPQANQFSLTTAPRVSWEDIHLLASIHTVLYSLRMLLQISGYFLNQLNHRPAAVAENGTQPSHDQELLETIRNLHEKLCSMPPIAALFHDIPHLRHKFSEADVAARNSTIMQLKGVLDPESNPSSNSALEGIEAEERASHAGRKHEENIADWIPAKLKKKKRRRTQQTNTTQTNTHSTNTFGLLSND